MKLRPQERSAILADEHPQIMRPFHKDEPCPFEVGEVTVLRAQRSTAGPVPQVSITITGIARGKKDEWIAHYSVRDDRGLYLARGTGYTRSAADSLDWEAPVDDPTALKAYAVQGRLRRAEQAAEQDEDHRKRERAIRDRLRLALEGLSADGQIALLAAIERDIQKAQMVAASDAA